MDDQTIAALCYALRQKDFDPGAVDPTILRDHQLLYTYDELHGGWLFRFPDEVKQTLAQLNEKDFEAVVGRWEPVFRDFDPAPNRAVVPEMLNQLVLLATTGVRNCKPLHWVAPSC
ncbi:hypothetical protein [Anatilimnocola floriformis]|uniref:hypothetical protein n=1 Tax=Anatilimnocola floriformis TaxID=2948575 RepID=UPI0020C2F1AE|nr:hypothetical protein [Anatilimnocola floriformis]